MMMFAQRPCGCPEEPWKYPYVCGQHASRRVRLPAPPAAASNWEWYRNNCCPFCWRGSPAGLACANNFVASCELCGVTSCASHNTAVYALGIICPKNINPRTKYGKTFLKTLREIGPKGLPEDLPPIPRCNPRKPPQPNVREPVVWSWAAQQLVEQTTYAATQSIVDEEAERRGVEVDALGRLRLGNEIMDSIDNDPALRREFYERTLHFISRDTPNDGPSPAGVSVDRAHARLLLWLRLYGHLR